MRYAVTVAVLCAGVAVGQELPKNTDEIEMLTPEAAETLAEHEGNLLLNGLTTISAEAAEALAKHWGYLSLDGLTTLSDKAAEALAKHKGDLYLDGLTTLSDKAAATLKANPSIRLPDKFK
jgi:hypothetical protein